MSDSFYFIPCAIERGGFSSERTFEIDTNDGGKLVGTANVEYLRTESRRSLNDDTPEYGEIIKGFVACRQIEGAERDGMILVEVPSADMIYVSSEDLVMM